MEQLRGLPDLVYYTVAHWYDIYRHRYDNDRQRYDNAAHRYDRSLLQLNVINRRKLFDNLKLRRLHRTGL